MQLPLSANRQLQSRLADVQDNKQRDLLLP